MSNKLGKVLVVEDDEDVLEMIKHILEECNFRVLTATNGRDALESFKEFGADAVLTDIRMPLMGGYRLIYEINKLNATIPTFTFSGYLNEFDQNDEKAKEPKSSFEKPLDMEKVIEAISSEFI